MGSKLWRGPKMVESKISAGGAILCTPKDAHSARVKAWRGRAIQLFHSNLDGQSIVIRPGNYRSHREFADDMLALKKGFQRERNAGIVKVSEENDCFAVLIKDPQAFVKSLAVPVEAARREEAA